MITLTFKRCCLYCTQEWCSSKAQVSKEGLTRRETEMEKTRPWTRKQRSSITSRTRSEGDFSKLILNWGQLTILRPSHGEQRTEPTGRDRKKGRDCVSPDCIPAESNVSSQSCLRMQDALRWICFLFVTHPQLNELKEKGEVSHEMQ